MLCHVRCAASSSLSAQVWPYLKPLRKWIKKQRSKPEGLWDMPQASAAPQLQQQQQQWEPRTTGMGGSKSDGLWDMPQASAAPQLQQQQQQWETRTTGMGGTGVQHSPLPHQMQQLAHSERRSGTGTGSPKHMLHQAFHEAAIAQSRQQPAVGTLPPAAGASAAAAAPGVSVNGGGGAFNQQDMVVSGPLVKLFGGAAVRKFSSSSSSGALSCSPGGFTFNRQPILHALAGPACVAAVPYRQQISGRG